MDHLNINEKLQERVEAFVETCKDSKKIDPSLYSKYEVKRGLRDISGKGVLTGLTEISEIISYTLIDSDYVPVDGQLYYHGINIEDIVKGFACKRRFGYEETVYLLLFGRLPSEAELKDFVSLLAQYREELPLSFVSDTIMKTPTKDVMNGLARCVLTLYAYDDKADDTSIDNVLGQCIELIALFPMLAVYTYQAYSHYYDGNSLFIHSPKKEYSAAENILHMLRPDGSFTKLEAEILDLCLVLHAEHGGGNNSTFTTHVVSSSGTDTYSTVAASLGSLKGPKHGGANIKVSRMFDDMMAHVKDWKNEEEVADYLRALLHKEAFDKAGLIYGMGHAVYSVSDPRARLLRQYVERLSKEKGLDEEFALYSMVETLAPKIIAQERKMYKGVSANIDFYSGFVYRMLGLPGELYTPLFAVARIAGWSAHRLEELINEGKIIRPAYKSISKHADYVPIEER